MAFDDVAFYCPFRFSGPLITITMEAWKAAQERQSTGAWRSTSVAALPLFLSFSGRGALELSKAQLATYCRTVP